MLSVRTMSQPVVKLEQFALEEREVEQALARVNVRAVDYADIYFESTISESVSMEEGIVKRARCAWKYRAARLRRRARVPMRSAALGYVQNFVTEGEPTSRKEPEHNA